MTDVTELLEEVMIDLVMGKIIGRKGFAECLLAREKEQKGWVWSAREGC